MATDARSPRFRPPDTKQLSINAPKNFCATTRRIRGPVAGGAATDDLDETRSWLDRVDALVHAVRLSGLPRLGALVGNGALLLGAAVRDADLLRRWLSSEQARSPGEREAVIVALGLLGDLPPIEDIWTDRADPERTAVLIAAIALGNDDTAERARQLERLDLMAEGAAARRLTEEALLRSQTQSRLSILD